MNYKEILKFWFDELSPQQKWIKDETLDNDIKKRFLNTLSATAAGENYKWRKTSQGRLAEIIVLDQFSRNIFRDSSRAFAQDAQALALTQEALKEGAHRELNTTELSFLIMPVMHSESKKIHNDYLDYFKVPGIEQTLDIEIKHKKIIDRFGRYPHRNEILMRSSSLEELEFLNQPDSSF
jgi:uncharacterized protein (DUF924 family)